MASRLVRLYRRLDAIRRCSIGSIRLDILRTYLAATTKEGGLSWGGISRLTYI